MWSSGSERVQDNCVRAVFSCPIKTALRDMGDYLKCNDIYATVTSLLIVYDMYRTVLHLLVYFGR